jgi:hypothetical protein
MIDLRLYWIFLGEVDKLDRHITWINKSPLGNLFHLFHSHSNFSQFLLRFESESRHKNERYSFSIADAAMATGYGASARGDAVGRTCSTRLCSSLSSLVGLVERIELRCQDHAQRGHHDLLQGCTLQRLPVGRFSYLT